VPVVVGIVGVVVVGVVGVVVVGVVVVCVGVVCVGVVCTGVSVVLVVIGAVGGGGVVAAGVMVVVTDETWWVAALWWVFTRWEMAALREGSTLEIVVLVVGVAAGVECELPELPQPATARAAAMVVGTALFIDPTPVIA
jgi:hypothetical protein